MNSALVGSMLERPSRLEKMFNGKNDEEMNKAYWSLWHIHHLDWNQAANRILAENTKEAITLKVYPEVDWCPHRKDANYTKN